METTIDPLVSSVSSRLSSTTLAINWRSFEYYPPLNRIRRYTEEHYREEIPLSCAAEIAGMEASYFSAFFRRKIGIRYTDWLCFLRISQAISLISSRDRPILEIAVAVGFSDPRSFQRAFKRITKMTAREFKEHARPA
ncbi:MAG TPA: AraC family transcriptional regulator [Thermoanaerobaculia bacterium]|jgi:two-component system response regulator YesN|nr:AraC family transcriptional regulator [Thermoanaerobaculia bacterium]